VFAADYPFLDVFWSILVFFMWVIWLWILITVFADIFRRHDIGGWAKAGWIVFVIVLPFLGVFIYIITQSGRMADRQLAVTGGPAADQIAKAKSLLDSGAIDEKEFQLLKSRALA
jgi:hypothetical protein